jgi:transposase InsO family protein
LTGEVRSSISSWSAPRSAGRRRPVARHSPGDRWCIDETYVKVNGVWRQVYRQLTSTARSSTCCSRPAATRRPLAGLHPCAPDAEVIPSEVVTDAAPVHLAVRLRVSDL